MLTSTVSLVSDITMGISTKLNTKDKLIYAIYFSNVQKKAVIQWIKTPKHVQH